MTELPIRWHAYANSGQMIDALVSAIAEKAASAISTTGRFHIVLAGGATPKPIYARLVKLVTPWDGWHVYFSDERCLPVGHRQRNDTMARHVWLDRVSIPADQVHAIPAELGPDASAEAYARVLSDVGWFDLTLLGLGEDGHTASLFPGAPMGTGPGAADVLPVHRAPKPPASRVTLSAARLARSHSLYLIVTGKDKCEALARLRDGVSMPIRSVVPENGIDLFLDSCAAPSEMD